MGKAASRFADSISFISEAAQGIEAIWHNAPTIGPTISLANPSNYY